MSLATVSAAAVRFAWVSRAEIALVDLREEAPFAKAHPLFAACIPLSRLELEALDAIPRRDTPIVLYDDGEGLVPTAAARLAALGYTDVKALDGGLQGWREAGLELFQDVNSASKAFGELVEHRRHTPFITPETLQTQLERTANLVVLDARRYDEFNTMSIPTGVSTPGAELVLRAKALAPDPRTTIVVNCAGRTRSIIGAQSLINAGVKNPVRALRNGAIGWTLAGQTLEHGQTRRAPDVAADEAQAALEAAAQVSYRAGVRRLDLAGLAHLQADVARTLYRFDVRLPEAYAAGHIPGFRNAQGGQLVQETDMFAAVRGARIVLADDIGVRAHMSASWLAQMGWEVYVLEGGFDGALETGPWSPSHPALPDAPSVSPASLADLIANGSALVIDVGPSKAYRQAHIPGARFAIRARLPSLLSELEDHGRRLIIISPDGALARLAAEDLRSSTGLAPEVLEGGTAAWRAEGLPLEAGFDRALSPPDDIYRRPYEGSDHPVEAMQAYLDWEFGLVDQLARDASHGFYVI
jgi:rhodanese-related sulfurtransferase